MKAEVKQKWIKALTSGKIPQAQGTFAEPDDKGELRADGPHCVLGVLANVMKFDINTYAGQGELTEPMAKRAGFKCTSPQVMMTPEVIKILRRSRNENAKGLAEAHQEYLDDGLPPEEVDLFELNDFGVPFRTLAKIIDLQYGED